MISFWNIVLTTYNVGKGHSKGLGVHPVFLRAVLYGKYELATVPRGPLVAGLWWWEGLKQSRGAEGHMGRRCWSVGSNCVNNKCPQWCVPPLSCSSSQGGCCWETIPKNLLGVVRTVLSLKGIWVDSDRELISYKLCSPAKKKKERDKD